MNETYTWTKTRLMGREYILQRGDAEAGRLAFEGAFTTTARVHIGGVEWTFTRLGLLTPMVMLRRTGESRDVAEARLRAGGGCDITIAGRMYRWKSVAFFRGEFGWVDESEAVLIRYKASVSATRPTSVTGDLPEDVEPLLVILGAYLLILTSVDVASMTAAVVAATAVG